MNIAQVQHFMAIARCKKFSAAAEDAYVSQSSLSKQIKALEEELGVELFVRSPAGASLTPAGEVFLEFSSRTIRHYENMLLRLEKFDATAQLRVRFGALPLMGAYELDADLADFQVDNMTTQIDYTERNQDELLGRLEMNRLDVAILRTDRLSPEEYDWIPLVRDEIVIVCSNRNPVARSRRISIGELKDARFVMLEPQSAIYVAFVEECRKSGFFPNVTFAHARHEPLLSAVSRDIGITALPRGLTHVRKEASLSCVPLENPLYTDVGLVVPKGRLLTPWAERLVSYFAERYESPRGPSEQPSPPELESPDR